ncbi:hypothetical protein G5V57_03205 [Nordella sp. HKS 07]|uniref:hypothetical protein n=1 Tax=Nordella sp. HKS 07 TaxID=2712222 RepID=UPI0013E0F9FC|nr:hypothetical protein [Nordella sp. HKS 07]QIG46268.1 hypothetical protein G5V57_03205 [Nordella sp. HKS 07]
MAALEQSLRQLASLRWLGRIYSVLTDFFRSNPYRIAIDYDRAGGSQCGLRIISQLPTNREDDEASQYPHRGSLLRPRLPGEGTVSAYPTGTQPQSPDAETRTDPRTKKEVLKKLQIKTII